MNLVLAIIFVVAILVLINLYNERQYIFDRRKKYRHPTLDYYDLSQENELNEMEAFSSNSYAVSSMYGRRKTDRLAV